MRKWLIVLISLVLVMILVIGACAPAALPTPSPPATEGEDAGRWPIPSPALPPSPPAMEIPPAPSSKGEGLMPEETGAISLGQLWASRLIIRNGEMSLVVEDVARAIDQIALLAEDMGGYVVSSKTWSEGERVSGSISVRVPASLFDDVLRSLRALAVEVLSEDTSSKDVSEEYVDLESQLRNLEATERQWLKLMERAETVEDALKVQRELSRTRGEIEQTKGRMQYLERSSETSLIRVSLREDKLDADFVCRTSARTGEKIEFRDRTRGGSAPYKYEWDFGDGATSTLKDPSHAYDLPGGYTVSLKVTDDRSNTDTEAKKGYITITAEPGWNAGEIAEAAVRALGTVGRALGNVLIWLGIFIPIWGPIVAILYWRHRRSKGA